VLDKCGKCVAALGQEEEIEGTPITHIKQRWQSLGLGWFSIEYGRCITGKCGTLLGPCKTFPMLLILETSDYTFIK